MSVAVTLAEAKQYLRLGNTSADALVQALADGCEDWVQEFCGVQFGEAVRADLLDGGERNLRLLRKPLRRVLSIADRETPGLTFVAGVDYFVVGERLLKRAGAGPAAGSFQQAAERWPEGRGRWEVTYACGYQAAAAGATTTAGDDAAPHLPLPAGLKVAVLELVRRAFDNRGGTSSESAAGWSVAWQDFAGSDVMLMLAPYVRADA